MPGHHHPQPSTGACGEKWHNWDPEGRQVKDRNIHLNRIPHMNDKEMWWQFPLAPAETTTILIVQGKTFDGVVLVTGPPLPHHGAVYTPLSGARSLELCRIMKFNVEDWKVSVLAVEEYRRLNQEGF
ncbi:hypothetical protein CRE_02644 [Caenorhabditis remanei]|uniref:Uncharacterized protein n=2 Tax=Caenorhabditis remanei TaxID=31234 RepID=E3NG22_CAERE|nr:hypothetical protein CRE_02644 [Caenorhabditis remanei]